MKHLFYLIMLVFVLASCGSSSSEDSEEEYDIEGQTEDGFEDGTYCADVTYYNPNTGTENTYTLEVEVYNNEVTQINWGNGGWMDEDHFYSQELDSDGSCSFTSDKGYDYTVQITGQDCGYTDESSFESDMQNEEESYTCPECGGEKNEYDNYCEDHKCPECGGLKDAYDDYCEDHTCPKCGDEKDDYKNYCRRCQNKMDDEDY